MKKTFIILAEGFEEIEALTVVDVLRRLNILCDICSLNGIEVTGSH
jgi:protein deglycase